MDFITLILLVFVLIIVVYQSVDLYTESSGQSCVPCPAKPPGTYYTSTSGCVTAACKSLADCPNVVNATKTITPCTDPVAGVSAGSPGECDFTCNSGYTKNGNGCNAIQQLTPIQRFKMDWGKQNAAGSVGLPPQIAASAPDCAKSCVNNPNCTAFVMDWSNAIGSGGDYVGGCTMFSSLISKATPRPRAAYSKIQ